MSNSGIEDMFPEIDDVVDKYAVYLQEMVPQQAMVFNQRRQSKPDAARLEAATFCTIRAFGYQVEVNEDTETGGADFMCDGPDGRFLLEVTHIDRDSITEKSGLPDELDEKARFYAPITEKLCAKAGRKAPQLSGADCPRVLAVGAFHLHSSVLLGRRAAEDLLTSEPKIAVPLGDVNAEPYETTQLESSVFFRFEEGDVKPCRQSISAILLITCGAESCHIFGLLHPEPAVLFQPSLLPNVPFLKLVHWPPKEGKLETEWVVGHPNALKKRFIDVWEIAKHAQSEPEEDRPHYAE